MGEVAREAADPVVCEGDQPVSQSRKRKRKRRETLQKLGVNIREGHRFQLGDDHWYRLRRGKVVQIPDEWVGKPWVLVAAPKPWRKAKKNRRRSQHKTKIFRQESFGRGGHGRVPREKRKGHLPDPTMGHPRQRSHRHASKRERRARDLEDGLL